MWRQSSSRVDSGMCLKKSSFRVNFTASSTSAAVRCRHTTHHSSQKHSALQTRHADKVTTRVRTPTNCLGPQPSAADKQATISEKCYVLQTSQ